MRLSLDRGLGVALLLVVLSTGFLAPSASASVAHEFEKSFGPDGTEATVFNQAGAIGVDQETHDVYVAVLGEGTVEKFDQEGAPTNFAALGSNEISGFGVGAGEALSQIAVDSENSHEIYVADIGAGAIKAFEQDGDPAEFTAGPGTGTNEIPAFSEVCGVATDANGAIYMGDYGTGVHVFSPSGEEITSFPVSEACNVAVDSTGVVYVNHYPLFGAPGVEKFTPSEFPVAVTTTYTSGGLIDSSETFGVSIDSGNDDVYVDERTQVAQFDDEDNLLGTFAEEISESEGVAVDGITERAYVSDVGGEERVRIYLPPPAEPPSVESTTAINITATSADLRARISPELFTTTYRFQYLTLAEFEANGFTGATETPEEDLGSAGTPQTARAHVGGLAPDTAYVFRVAAENQNNEGNPVFSLGSEEFTTFAVTAPGLPDDRAYEMVSPPAKLGEVFPPEPNPLFSGSCPTECLPGGNAQLMPMQSTDDGDAIVFQGQPFSGGFAAGPNEYLAQRVPDGWRTQSLSASRFSSEEGQAYKAFSSDLTRGVLYQIEPALSPEAPTREGKTFANLYLRDEDETFQPLVVVEPPQRDPGTESSNKFRIGFAAANSGGAMASAFSHMVFEANDALTEEDLGIAPEAPGVAANERNLYEWVEGELRLVNVLPGNASAAAGAVFGSGHELVGGDETQGADFDRVISANGDRIFWSDKASGQVYVRIDGEETREIDDPGTPGKFLVASADGSKVLLSDGCLYDVDAETCEADLAQGEGEKFQGILGTAVDLSRIYFVDTAVLTGGDENDNGEQAEANEFNLYTWSEGNTAFIGTLLERDNAISTVPPAVGDWKPSSGSRLAQVSPDGTYLAFMSRAALTGYDNSISDEGTCFPAPSGSSMCYEVFAYNAIAGSLACASCNPTGEAPLGSSNLSLIFRGVTAKSGFPQPGNLTGQGQGRLFFESQDDLSPHDINGHVQDVYQWEPDGVGGCARADGCISLISSGHSSVDSYFLDATPSGDDIFIVTREQLLAKDKDEKLDLYDARVGGGIEELLSAPCGGEACLGPVPSPSPLLSPGSGEATDPGNAKPRPKPRCKPGFVRKQHGKCVKKKHKRHHGRSANRNRGGSK